MGFRIDLAPQRAHTGHLDGIPMLTYTGQQCLKTYPIS